MDDGKIYIRYYSCTLGDLVLGDYEGRLCLCDWQKSRRHRRNLGLLMSALRADIVERPTPLTDETIAQIEQYIGLSRREFNIPLLQIGTEFQKQVWTELLNTHYGQRLTYLEVAKNIGRPTACRAVGNAVGANPISILVPCHRVNSPGSKVAGYAGGVEAKRRLLQIEGIMELDL